MSSRRFLESLGVLAIGLASVSAAAQELSWISCDRSPQGECLPGKIADPQGASPFVAAEYNPDRDEYVIAYPGRVSGDSLPSPLVGILSTSGAFAGEIPVARNTGATHVAIEYNPDRQEYLVAWRNGGTESLLARYLKSDLSPIGAAFPMPTRGAKPSLSYSPDSQLYMLTYTQDVGDGTSQIWYHMIRGDSTVPGIIRSEPLERGPVHSDSVAYGSAQKRFLIVYVTDTGSGPRGLETNVSSACVDMNGTLDTKFPVDLHPEHQRNPVVTYRSRNWIIGYENWANADPSSADFKGISMFSCTGNQNPFFFTESPGRDSPGALTYNPVRKTTVAVWRTESQILAQEFNDLVVFGSSTRSHPIVLADLAPPPTSDEPFVVAAASRSVGSDPQAMVLWRRGAGGDGVHAGIIHQPPVPSRFLHIGKPRDGSATLSPFTIKGWAVDIEAAAGTGIWRVRARAKPTGTILNKWFWEATYGSPRPGVAARFGDARFEPSGFEFSDVTLPDGDWDFRIVANSTVKGKNRALIVNFSLHVGPDPRMALDQPRPGAAVSWPFELSGWAIDRAAPRASASTP